MLALRSTRFSTRGCPLLIFVPGNRVRWYLCVIRVLQLEPRTAGLVDNKLITRHGGKSATQKSHPADVLRNILKHIAVSWRNVRSSTCRLTSQSCFCETWRENFVFVIGLFLWVVLIDDDFSTHLASLRKQDAVLVDLFHPSSPSGAFHPGGVSGRISRLGGGSEAV